MNGTKKSGIRETTSKYFGMYRGTVAENNDPKKLCRIRASVPSLLGDKLTEWALPCMPYGGVPKQGMYTVPDVGAHVWIQFEAGDIGNPIWVGTYWEKSWEPGPTTRLIQTQSGHILQFDDVQGKEVIRLKHASGAGIWIDHNGSISLNDHSGERFKLDAYKNETTLEDANGNQIKQNDEGTRIECSNGNIIEMSAAGIRLEAPSITFVSSQVHLGDEGGEQLIKGQSFLSLFATHIHTVSPIVGGPTSVPIPQGEISTLSASVKAK